MPRVAVSRLVPATHRRVGRLIRKIGILESQPPGDRSPVTRCARGQGRHPPLFVGRNAELRQLVSALDRPRTVAMSELLPQGTHALRARFAPNLRPVVRSFLPAITAAPVLPGVS